MFYEVDGVWVLEKHGFNDVGGFFLFCCFVVVVWLDLQCDGDWDVVWLNSGNV